VTAQNLGPDKADVRRFWEAASCGEIYAEGSSAREKFRLHAAARYRLEPYLRDFARFEEGRGQDVLEIGVGMGADHVEWARSGPRRLAGIDLTPRALAWTAQRLETYGFASDLCEADAENLPFRDNSFSIIYSWGVLHHSPNTQKAFSEAHRVLRPGGTLRVMVYHRPSVVGLMLWARYALATGHPACSLTEVYARHLESPGTKGYTIAEARSLVAPFGAGQIRSAVSFGDLLLGEVGQQHAGLGLALAKQFWPRPFIRRLPMLGLLLLIEAKKEEVGTCVGSPGTLVGKEWRTSPLMYLTRSAIADLTRNAPNVTLPRAPPRILPSRGLRSSIYPWRANSR
jgi:ubiquinone/menaquinone biosynthesis C-methylase UbiE